jgi:hypothetical protein
MSVERSIARDAKALALGLPRVEAEIVHWEGNQKKTKSIRHRLWRLYEARKHLTESPEDSVSLVDQLKAINNA